MTRVRRSELPPLLGRLLRSAEAHKLGGVAVGDGVVGVLGQVGLSGGQGSRRPLRIESVKHLMP